MLKKNEHNDLSHPIFVFQKFRLSHVKIKNYEFGAKVYGIWGGSYSRDSERIKLKKKLNIINYFSFGGFHKFNFYRNFGFRNELLISRFESIIDLETDGLAEINLKNKNISYVLDIPLLVFYKLPLKKKKITFNIGIVPTLTLIQTSSTNNIKSNEIVKINDYTNKSVFKFKTQFGFDYEYKKFVFGFDIYEDFLGISNSSKFEFGIGLSIALKLKFKRIRYFGVNKENKKITI